MNDEAVERDDKSPVLQSHTENQKRKVIRLIYINIGVPDTETDSDSGHKKPEQFIGQRIELNQ